MRPDPLHELIHSLSPSERRYFKLNARPGGGQADSNFMRLFEVLHKQPEYDEDGLREIFAKDRLVEHLSSEKNYLYRLLLRSLRSMADGANPRLRVRAEIDNGILLFERGLYFQSQKLLRRARKLAEETEQHLALLEIIVWERRLWKILSEKDRPLISQSLIRAHIDILERLRRTYSYYDLYDRMYLLTHQKFQLRGQEDHPELKAILADPMLSDIGQADSFEARHFYWLCQAWRHQLSGEQGQLYDALSQNIAWWEAHPAILAADSVRYVQLLSNLLHAAGLLSHYAEFPAIFSKIRALPRTHIHGDNHVLQTLYYYELLYFMNVADWKAAMTTAKEAIDFLGTAGDRIALGRKLAFWYNLSILFFIHEDFKSALLWVNAILDGSGPEIREDIQHFSRLLVILIHFELGHWEILEYLHRSSYRYLFNRNQLFPYEKRLLDTLKSLMEQVGRPEQADILQSLKADLLLLLPPQPNLPGLQELNCWIDARLSRRKMADVMAETLGFTPGAHPQG